MASTIVDLPEPMSPVTRVFCRPAVRRPDPLVEGAPVVQLRRPAGSRDSVLR